MVPTSKCLLNEILRAKHLSQCLAHSRDLEILRLFLNFYFTLRGDLITVCTWSHTCAMRQQIQDVTDEREGEVKFVKVSLT